jgi:catechol 2,3-dioxygenase-like lactoylglutathione lyase family enzyme
MMRNANPINIRALDHVVLRVRDLESMVVFYSDVLGARLERGPGDLGLAQMRAGSSLIDLVDVNGPLGEAGGAAPDHKAPNMDHFCLHIQPWNNDAIREHLQRHEVTISETASRYGANGYGPSIYLTDPEGNQVELKGD